MAGRKLQGAPRAISTSVCISSKATVPLSDCHVFSMKSCRVLGSALRSTIAYLMSASMIAILSISSQYLTTEMYSY